MTEHCVKPIFIFSLPRSGSTLLQRILTSSEDISTTSEPWVLLPFLYALREEGVYAEYGHFGVYKALKDLCDEMPNGEEDYLYAVRLAMLQVYTSVSSGTETYFLDKTPRYSLVAEEVVKTFPDGKFIFLWRNPLSVVASMVNTFSNGKWRIFHFKVDLYDGVCNLMQAFEKNKSQSFSIKYEDLVAHPEKSLRDIEVYLGLKENELRMDGFSSVKLKGSMGDPTGVKKYKKISTESLESWKSALASPWRKYWCKRYLKWIGNERLRMMGYELDELVKDLESIPNQWRSLPLDLLYHFYGELYSFFEFKIFKDKVKKILTGSVVKKHD